jgi:hypothetical protein
MKTFQIRQEKNIKALKKRFYQPLMSSMTDIGWMDSNLDALAPLSLKKHSSSRRKGLGEKFFEHDFRPFYKYFESLKSKTDLDTLREIQDSIVPQPMETFKYFRKMFPPLLFICFSNYEEFKIDYVHAMVTSSYNRYLRIHKKDEWNHEVYFSNLLQSQTFLMDLIEFMLKRNEVRLLKTLFTKIDDIHSITKLKKRPYVQLFYMHKQIDLLIDYLRFTREKLPGEAFKQQFIDLVCTVINNIPDCVEKFFHTQEILRSLDLVLKEVFDSLLLPDNEQLILDIGTKTELFPQVQHYDRLIQSGLYSVALTLPVSLLADALFSKQNFKVLMSNLKRRKTHRLLGHSTTLCAS